MKKALLLFVSFTIAQSICGQIEEKKFQRIESLILENNIELKTGILYDRVYPFANLEEFNEGNNTSNKTHFEQALHEMFLASNYIDFIDTKSLRAIVSKKNNVIPIGVLITSFEKLDLQSSLRSSEDISVSKPKRAIVVSPLVDYVWGGSFVFQFSEDLFFRGGGAPEMKTLLCEVNGKTIPIIQNGKFINKTISASFSDTGYKTLKFKGVLKDGFSFETSGSFHNKLKPTTISKAASNSGIENGRSVSTIAFKGYEESSAIKGEVEYRIFYRKNGNNRLFKPVIIIDGFDPGDRRKFQDADSPLPADDHRSMEDLMFYQDNGQVNLIDEMRDLGYDVVLVNHPTYYRNGRKIDGGADYIERNAFNLVTLINTFNARLRSSGSSEKLIIVGPSMGGQISRYALAYMEKNGMNHNTRLWVSVDSPHLGANIPLGIQSLIYQLRDLSPAARDFWDNQLKSVAAKQQLIEQFENSNGRANQAYCDGRTRSQGYAQDKGAPFFRRYYDNLFRNGLSGSKGYPKLLRKISLVNGAMNGSKAYFNPFTQRNDSYASDRQKVLELKAFQRLLTAKEHISSIETYFMPKFNQEGVISYFWRIPRAGKRTYHKNLNSRGNMDNVPGGWFPSQQDFAEPVTGRSPVSVKGGFWEYPLDNALSGFLTILGGNFWETRALKHNNSFIASVSAIGHLKPERDWAQRLDENLVCKGETPFNSYFGYSVNTQHTSFTLESVDWLLKELAGNPQDPYFPINATNLVGESCLCQSQTKNYSFRSCSVPGSVVKWEVSPNLTRVSNNSNTITIKAQSDYRSQGWIKATFRNGASVQKNIWVGRPKTPTFLSGPSTVQTGALVTYTTRTTPGANSYSWKLPYPFDVVSRIDYFARNWQMRRTTGISLGAFTGYSKKSGYVQVSGVNKCGTGGAKLLRVTHSSRGGGGIPVRVPSDEIGTRNNLEKNDVMVYPNPFNGSINVGIPNGIIENIDPDSKLISKIYGLVITDMSGKIVLNQTFNKHGVENVNLRVDNLQPGAYNVSVQTNAGDFSKLIVKN